MRNLQTFQAGRRVPIDQKPQLHLDCNMDLFFMAQTYATYGLVQLVTNSCNSLDRSSLLLTSVCVTNDNGKW